MRTSDYSPAWKQDADKGGSALTLVENLGRPVTERKHSKRSFYIIVAILLVLGFSIVALVIFPDPSSESKSLPCQTPRIRREWRSLYPEEKSEYIRAVKCLETRDSVVSGQGSLYDDFVYIHMKVGKNSHHSASFLTWHRAFLHMYEETLIHQCGFKGVIPYWAWDLDWWDLQESSIWDPVEGFGGDGDPAAPASPGEGHCLANGPFYGSQRIFYDNDTQPHCLGRGFHRQDSLTGGILHGEWFRPEEMGRLKRSSNYDALRSEIEDRFHNGLHWTIGGDFIAWTAANDPVFFLHHGQLDRLWWMWQQEDPKSRLNDYSGVSFNTTEGMQKQGTLEDDLNFMGLWRDTKVSEIMNTEGDVLCYRYS